MLFVHYLLCIVYVFINNDNNNDYYDHHRRRRRWNKHSRWHWCFQCPDPAPLISKLEERCPTAANKNECLFHRPIALTLRISVKLTLGGMGDGGSPTQTTSRVNVYFRHRYSYPCPRPQKLCRLHVVLLCSTRLFYKVSGEGAWVWMSQPSLCSRFLHAPRKKNNNDNNTNTIWEYITITYNHIWGYISNTK